MKSIKLGEGIALNNIDHNLSVPVVVQPAIVKNSICSVTMAQKTNPDIGLLLSEEEYAALPESDKNRIEEGEFSVEEVFNPESFLKQEMSVLVQELVLSVPDGMNIFSYTDSDGVFHQSEVTGDFSMKASLEKEHEGGNAIIPLKWESSNPEVISVSEDQSKMVVVRPEGEDASDQNVILTVIVDMSEAEIDGTKEARNPVKYWRAAKSFNLIVKAIPVSSN